MLLLCILVVAVVKLQPLRSPGGAPLGTILGARAILCVLGAVLSKARPVWECPPKRVCTCIRGSKVSENPYHRSEGRNILAIRCASLHTSVSGVANAREGTGFSSAAKRVILGNKYAGAGMRRAYCMQSSQVLPITGRDTHRSEPQSPGRSSPCGRRPSEDGPQGQARHWARELLPLQVHNTHCCAQLYTFEETTGCEAPRQLFTA